jgi:hypothetical protein
LAAPLFWRQIGPLTRENTAKPGSLKKNYGSIELQKRRRRIEPPKE